MNLFRKDYCWAKE